MKPLEPSEGARADREAPVGCRTSGRRVVAASRTMRLGRAMNEADVAAVLHQLSATDQATVVRALSQERAGEVLAEMDDGALLGLVRALDAAEVSRILDGHGGGGGSARRSAHGWS